MATTIRCRGIALISQPNVANYRSNAISHRPATGQLRGQLEWANLIKARKELPKCLAWTEAKLREHRCPFWFCPKSVLKANEQFKLRSAHSSSPAQEGIFLAISAILAMSFSFHCWQLGQLSLAVATVLFSGCCCSAGFMASQKPINAQLSSTFNLPQFYSLFLNTLKKKSSLAWRLKIRLQINIEGLFLSHMHIHIQIHIQVCQPLDDLGPPKWLAMSAWL